MGSFLTVNYIHVVDIRVAHAAVYCSTKLRLIASLCSRSKQSPTLDYLQGFLSENGTQTSYLIPGTKDCIFKTVPYLPFVSE